MFGIHYVDNSLQAIAERDFYVTFTPTAVPEPGTIFMIALSALATGGYVLYRRYRQRLKMEELIDEEGTV